MQVAWSFRAERAWLGFAESFNRTLLKRTIPFFFSSAFPSNHKWYRNLAVAHTLVHTMRHYKDEWKIDLEARGQRELERLKQMRNP